MLFVDELDRVFGATARTSFTGQIDQAIDQTAKAAKGGVTLTDLGLEGAKYVAGKVRNINDEAAFKAIEELLKRGSQ